MISYFEESQDFKESDVDWINYGKERLGKEKKNLKQSSLDKFVARRLDF